MFGMVTGTVLARHTQPAEQRVRLTMAIREPGTGRAIKVRLNLDEKDDRLDAKGDRPELAEGAVLRLKARLMPPAPPMLPGGYDFARAAWFAGLAATGKVVGPAKLVRPGESGGVLRWAQVRLAQHIRARVDGSVGGIAAALASGDQGAIAQPDQ